MAAYFDGNRWQPAAFLAPRIASFSDFLASNSPELLPGARGSSLPSVPGDSDVIKDLPHATTIVAATCDGGVVLADRSAQLHPPHRRADPR